MTLARAITMAGVPAALAVGLGLLAGAAPPPMAAPQAAPAIVDTASVLNASPTPSRTAEAVALPQQEVAAPPEPAAVTVLPLTGPQSWAIAIGAVGYQDELDQCLWVRMDLAATAPIVGAHNYCGGGDVLEMALGDSVTLAGTGLDGVYLVTDSRDARAGQNAAEATAGLSAAVILQTCYWRNDGSERLVALTRVG